MSVFVHYADLYDLYYKDKDYASEASFVLELCRSKGINPKTVLDLGCGTGRHLEEFHRRGLTGTGVDLSSAMLEQARTRLEGTGIKLHESDIISFRDKNKYDMVVAMFAVMGYLISNDELLAGMKTASSLLRPGGLFIFDGWFGPAVLNQKPEIRKHEYSHEGKSVTREAIPKLDPVSQTVDVLFNVTSKDASGKMENLAEHHVMRFFFVQETKLLLSQAGLKLIFFCPFLEPEGIINVNTWNITFVAGASDK